MENFYKSQENEDFLISISNDSQETDNVKEDLPTLIIYLIENEKKKNYQLTEQSILDLIIIFKKRNQINELYQIISPFPLLNSLINLTYIDPLQGISLQCLSNLVTIKPDVYQAQIFQNPKFIDFLIQEFNNEQNPNKYEFALLIANIIEGFKNNSNLFISKVNFDEFSDFSKQSIKNFKISLYLMRKIICNLKIENNIYEIFIKIAFDIFEAFLRNQDVDDDEFTRKRSKFIHKMMEFINDMITFNFLTIIPLDRIGLLDRVFNFISGLLISDGIDFYQIVVEKSTLKNEYIQISIEIVSKGIEEIISWCKELDFLYPKYVNLLYLLIKNSDLFKIDFPYLIGDSSIVPSLIQNLDKYNFKMKMFVFDFINTFIENSKSPDSQLLIVKNDYSQIFFQMFHDFINQMFNEEKMLYILKVFSNYISLFKLNRCDASNALFVFNQHFNFCEALDQIMFSDEYSHNDEIIGRVKLLLKIFAELKPPEDF